MAKQYDLGTVKGKITFDYDKNGVRRARDDMGKFVESSNNAGSTFDKNAKKIAKSAIGLIGNLGKIAAGMAAISSGMNIIIGLGGALITASGAALLIPGALAAGGAALATFKLGADGIKKAFEGMKPAVDNLKAAVSSSFEKSLLPAVNNLKTILPQVTKGFQSIAVAMGGVATKISIFLKTKAAVGDINTILQATSRVVQNVGKAAAPLLAAFLDIATVGAQMFVGMTTGAGAAAQSFADFIKNARDTGQIETWIRNAIAVFKELWAIIVQVGGIVQAVIKGFQDAGAGLGGSLSAVLLVVNQFLSSFEGQEIIKSLATALKTVAEVVSTVLMTALKEIGPALPPLLDAFKQLAEQVLPLLVGAIKFLAPLLVEVAKAIADNMDWIGPLTIGILAWAAAQWLLNIAMDANPIGLVILAIAALVAIVALIITNWDSIVAFFRGVWDAVWKWTSDLITKIRDFIVGVWDGIVDFIKGLGAKIGAAFTAVIDWFKTLPGKIGTWLASLPQTLWDAFTTAIKFAGNAVIQGIEWIIAFFIAMPLRTIQALSQFGSMLIEWIVGAWNGFIAWLQEAVPALLNWFSELPGKIIEAISNFGEMIVQWFKDAWERYKQAQIEGAAAAIEFIKGLPQRIIDAISNFGNMIADWARSAWQWCLQTIKDGGNAVLDWISGIPRWIVDRLGDLGNLLVGAGKAIIDGLLAGIKATIGAIWDFVGGIGAKIKSLKGPIQYDRKLLIAEGSAIMNSLHTGLLAGFDPVIKSVGTMGDRIKQTMQDSLAGGFNVAATGTVSAVNGIKGTDILAGAVSANLATSAGIPAPGTDTINGSTAMNIGNLVLQIAGNLDPTNPTEFRKAIVAIKDGIRGVERQNA